MSGQIPKSHIEAGEITIVFRVFVITDFGPNRISPDATFKLKKKLKISHPCERLMSFTFDEPNDEQNNEQYKDEKVSPQLIVD